MMQPMTAIPHRLFYCQNRAIHYESILIIHEQMLVTAIHDTRTYFL